MVGPSLEVTPDLQRLPQEALGHLRVQISWGDSWGGALSYKSSPASKATAFTYHWFTLASLANWTQTEWRTMSPFT